MIFARITTQLTQRVMLGSRSAFKLPPVLPLVSKAAGSPSSVAITAEGGKAEGRGNVRGMWVRGMKTKPGVLFL
jgi:hypothetical protein